MNKHTKRIEKAESELKEKQRIILIFKDDDGIQSIRHWGVDIPESDIRDDDHVITLDMSLKDV